MDGFDGVAGEGVLDGGRSDGFGAAAFIIPAQAPEAEAAGEGTAAGLLDEEAVVELFIEETRFDLAIGDFLVLPVAVVEAVLVAVALAAVEAKIPALVGEGDVFVGVAFFLVVVVVVMVLVVAVVVVFLLFVGKLVEAALRREAAGEPILLAVIGQAGGASIGAGAGVEDAFDGAAVVTGALAAGGDAPNPAVPAIVEGGVAAMKAVVGAGDAGQGAMETAVALVFGFVVAADHVDDAAHGAGAVEEGAGAAEDFDAVEALGVDGFAVVAALGAEGAGADAVLEDEDAVAIEAADNGASGAGAEAAAVDAGLAVEDIAEGGGGFGGEGCGVEGECGGEGLEEGFGAVGRGGDGKFLAEGGDPHGEVDGFGSAVFEVDDFAGVGEALAGGEQSIASGGKAGKGVLALVIAFYDAALGQQEDADVVKRLTVGLESNCAADFASVSAEGGGED